jgi:Tfp pilus assembly protein PilO
MIDKYLARLSGRERTALMAAVLVISVLFLDRLIIGPIISRIKTLSEKVQEKEVLLGANKRILSNGARVREENEIYSKYSFKALSAEEEMASVLSEIEALAAESKIYLMNSSPSGTREDGLLKVYVIKIESEGSMEQLFSFMHAVENSRKMMSIEDARIKPKEKSSDVMTCDLLITKKVMI